MAPEVPPRRASTVPQRHPGRHEPRRPAAPPIDEHGPLRRRHSVLLAALGGPSGHHGVGSDPPGVREQSRGRDRENALRPLLHQASVVLARRAHSLRYGEDRTLRPGIPVGGAAPRSGSDRGGWTVIEHFLTPLTEVTT